MSENGIKGNERDFSLDLIKVTSCILIVILHSPFLCEGLLLYVYRAITAVAVPSFMAVSGYLIFYYRNMKYRNILKQALRLTGVFLVWWCVYTLVNYNGSEPLIFWAIRNSEGWHLWYLVIYIKILLFYPFIRIIADSRRLAVIFSVLWLILVSIRFTLGCIGVDSIFLRPFNFPMFEYTGYLGGTIMGYYPTECLGLFIGGGMLISWLKKTSIKAKVLISLLGLTGIVVTAIMVTMTIRIGGKSYFDYALQPLQINVVITSIGFIAFMLLISHYIDKRMYAQKFHTIITAASQKTLGVYVVHPLIYRIIRMVPENSGGGGIC